MPWPITYHDEQPDDYQIGDMWPEPGFAKSNIISDTYKEEHVSERPPLMVCMPSKHDPRGELFLVDRIPNKSDRTGWTVTIIGDLVDGKKPNITVTPSINCGGSYHGWIKHGVISDDCEGRVYQEPDPF